MAIQEARILTFLNQTLGEVKPKDIAKALGIPQPSVRRALFILRERGILSKPKKSGTVKKILFGTDFGKELLKPFHKYTFDLVIYANGVTETWRTVTYSRVKLNIQDLMVEIANELESENEDRASISYLADETGIVKDKVSKMPFEYPIKEVWRTKRKREK